jgi:2-oxoglutarate ferredoxin oxidoreductase subunit alpha
MEHMTPVILLSDGYLANGSEMWKVPSMSELPEIKPPFVSDNDDTYQPYKRNPDTLVRPWAIPGQEGLRHQVGGLEKSDITGNISYDPYNHEKMTIYRPKDGRVWLPLQGVIGQEAVISGSWMRDLCALYTAVAEPRKKDGASACLVQLH